MKRIEHHNGGLAFITEARKSEVDAVAEVCKRRQIEGVTGDKEMRHLAEFPRFIVTQYCNDKGISIAEWMENPAHARAMMNDPALAYFRVDRGRV